MLSSPRSPSEVQSLSGKQRGIQVRTIRVAYWVAAVVLGAAQTWYMRHRIFSDGISYLSIAQAYQRGDWHNALSTYWSPLYSWLVAAYLSLFRVSLYWQASSLHVVNFIAFLAACWAFEKFALELIARKDDETWEVASVSRNTILAVSCLTILYGGLVLIGLGYVSPDMLAYAVVGFLAWMTLRFRRGNCDLWHYIAFGGVLGFAFLDRAAFAALIPLYVVCAVMSLKQEKKWMPLLIMTVSCMVVVGPFLIAVSRDRGKLALSDTGKLNYGWEVNGAARWSHWQGEPYNIGKPEHPERLILKDPVPVFEFAEPVGGPYPPWYDPSYWYSGIEMRFNMARQFAVLRVNLLKTAIVFLLSPALPVVMILLLAGARGWRAFSDYVRNHFWILLPILAGTAMYCLVFVDKRYLAGFVVVAWLCLLVEADGPAVRFAAFTEPAARALCGIAFAAVILYRMIGPIAATAADIVHGGERDRNFNWTLAQKMEAIGVRRGDKVAYLGLAKDADWVRILDCRTVAEVPIVFESSGGIVDSVLWNQKNIKAFLESDDAAREKVYDAFRKSGAVIAIAVPFPDDQQSRGWSRVVDPSDTSFPKHDGQFQEQFTTSYRWLVKR
jgi:hypothetical protein